MNKAVLLQLQQDKQEAWNQLEARAGQKQAYENMNYEGHETQQQTEAADIPSEVPGHSVEPKERVDRL